MNKKIVALLSMLVIVLTGCKSNSQESKPSDNTIISDPFIGDASNSGNLPMTTASFEIGIINKDAKLTNNTLQVPLMLKGDEWCEELGIKVYIDGILQEFSPDNSENYSYNNIMSVKTDDTDYLLKIKAKFDESIEPHTISTVSIYNPEFAPKAGMSLGNNHQAAAGAFRTLPITYTELEYADNTTIYQSQAPSPITKEQSEKYNLKGEYDEAFLLLQNDGGKTYALNENGTSVSLQFVAGTQAAGSEKYRVSFYKNHELTAFNGDYYYLDISLEGGKISITDIELSGVKEGDFLYCIAVPTASYNEFAFPKKTDTVVVVKS